MWFSNNVFTIPELPFGLKLNFILYSSWDDPFYMGLNAIEIFTKDGSRINVEKVKFPKILNQKFKKNNI